MGLKPQRNGEPLEIKLHFGDGSPPATILPEWDGETTPEEIAANLHRIIMNSPYAQLKDIYGKVHMFNVSRVNEIIISPGNYVRNAN